MVYSGLFPISQEDYPDLRDALEKLQLNDASLTFEPKTFVDLGFAVRGSFLGILDREITRMRLEREFDTDLFSTALKAAYRAVAEIGAEKRVSSPTDRHDGTFPKVRKALQKYTIIVPSEYFGETMKLCQQKRGEMGRMNDLAEEGVEMQY